MCSLSGGSIISFIEDSLGFDPFIGEENFPTRLNAQGDSPGLAGVLEFEIAIDLPAGDYSLFGESVDTHSGRASALNPVQPSEQWFAEFLAADGSVLATSGTTGDIPDLVRFGEWSGPIGDISLSENAVSIRVLHATPGTPTQNSFQPVCLSAVAELTVDPEPAPARPIVCTVSGGSIISFIEDSLGFDPFIGEENFPTRLNAQGDSPGLAGVLEFEIAIDLPAGDYSLFGESVDTHSGRASALNPVQPSEQWFAEFLAADGSVLATSGTTGDIPDLVRFGEWSGPIGDISLSENAVSIRVLHATPGTPTQNSFQPVCLSAVADASFVEVIPEQIEEEAPDEFVEAPTPQAVEPEVLGVVDVAPVAQSQPGNPTFTG